MVYTYSVYRSVENAPPQMQRHIALEGASNVRDIGGYATHDGRRTRWGTFLRADSLHGLTPGDQRALLRYNVRTVIDLRFQSELESAPNVFAHLPESPVSYVHLPLHEDQLAIKRDDPSLLPQSTEAYYKLVLDHCRPQIKRIFDRLSSAGAMPIITHCTAGKDRTGIIVALTLGALGVPDETIVEDYTLTERYAAALLVRLHKRAIERGVHADWHRRMLECKPQAMHRTLRYLNERYGGAVNYLREAGLSEAQIERLHAALLT
jgi:protein-tyrosine phosphatase